MITVVVFGVWLAAVQAFAYWIVMPEPKAKADLVNTRFVGNC